MAEMALLSLRTTARRLHVSESTVRNWFDNHVLRGYRLPTGARRIPASEVERLEREMFGAPTSFVPNDVNAWPKSAHSEVPQSSYPDF
jgi:excisionase family DNA binding protein